ncbi:hypothetical protein C9439_07900 [archaeon SCG-AAA382B04]|nr:hypothetical protein C9439_07900 [archaeon SCG-AAA382B04]
MDLSSVQQEILNALIALFQEKKEAIKGQNIASSIKKQPGTIRNQMQWLKALNLIESVQGPKGGYKPTSKAYSALDLASYQEGETVDIFKKGKKVEGATIIEIDLTTIPQPDVCKSEIKLIGDVRKFEQGDDISIGPTPVNNLFFKGKISGRDDVNNKLIMKIQEIHSIPNIPVEDIASKDVVTISPNDSVMEVVNSFVKHDIRGAPVVDEEEIIGMIIYSDVGEALIEDEETKAKDFMRDTITIDFDEPLISAVKKFRKHQVNRVAVVKDDELVGIITYTDVLRRLTAIGIDYYQDKDI